MAQLTKEKQLLELGSLLQRRGLLDANERPRRATELLPRAYGLLPPSERLYRYALHASKTSSGARPKLKHLFAYAFAQTGCPVVAAVARR